MWREILCSHQRIAQLCWNVKINETNLLYLKNILCSFQVSMLFIWFSNSYESPFKKNKTKQNKKNTKKQNEKEKTLLSHLGPVVCKTLPFSHLCRQLQKVSKNPIFSDLCISLNSDTPSLFIVPHHTGFAPVVHGHMYSNECMGWSGWRCLSANFFFLICSAHFVSWLDGQKCFEFFIIFFC